MMENNEVMNEMGFKLKEETQAQSLNMEEKVTGNNSAEKTLTLQKIISNINMKKAFTLISFILFSLILVAEPIKIITVQSYVQTPTLGKSYNEEMTVVFEVDTLEKQLTIVSPINKTKYKMSNFYPTIHGAKATVIKFDVSVSNSITKRYLISIPKSLVGQKISVKETMVTATREMPPVIYETDTYATEDASPTYRTKYIKKHFHDINKTTSAMDHKCLISYTDKMIAITDLDGVDEMHLLAVTSVEEVASRKIYRCQTKDEEYLFEVLNPQTEYSTPIFTLTRLVNNEPVVSTDYFGDIME